MNPEILLQLVKTKMPYGKYEGRLICDVPTFYLEWMARENAFPKGKLGDQLRTMYEIRLNGLEDLLKPLKSGSQK
ncbi:MAG: DUF3820 family protein [Flavobacteriales bacterium]|nr:DUF3820 family protein [Flavobacteriales bacterium]